MINKKTVVSENRIAWIDVSKAICIISIILGHLNGAQPVFYTGLTINDIIFSYHVPVFFILAGFTFKKQVISRDYINHKFRRLMGAYFTTCAFILLMDSLNLLIEREASIKNITHAWAADIIRSFFASGTIRSFGSIQMESMIGAIWFLPVLFFSLIFMQILENHLPDMRKQYALLGILTIAVLIIRDMLWLPFSILCVPPCTLLIRMGIDFRKYRLLDRIKPMYATALTAFTAWALYHGYGRLYLVTDTFADLGLSLALAAAASTFIMLLSRILSKIRYLQFIGRNTLILLCVHNVDIDTMGKWWSELSDKLHLSIWGLLIIRFAAYNVALLIILFILGRLGNKPVLDNPVTAMGSNRDRTIDILRGILINSVLIGHIEIDGTMRAIIYSCHMIAFIFISGYFFRENLTLKKQFSKIIRSLLFPYMIFCFIDFIIASGGLPACKSWDSSRLQKYLLGMSFSKNIFVNTQSVGPVYFVLLLFIVRLLYSVINRICKTDILRAIIVIAVSITGLYIGTAGFWLPWSADVAMYCLVYYMLGHYFSKYGILKKITNNKISYFLLACIWAMMIYKGSMEIAVRNYGGYTAVITGSLAGTILLYMWAERIGHSTFIVSWGISTILALAGQASFYILVIHTLLAGRIAGLIVNSTGINASYIYYLISNVLFTSALGVAAFRVVTTLKKWLKTARQSES